MKQIQTLLTQRPLLCTIAVIAGAVGLLMLCRPDPGAQAQLMNWPRLAIQYGTALGLFYLMARLDWARAAGLTTPREQWHPRWLWATLPIMSIGLLNLTGAEWDQLTFSAPRVSAWALANIGTGLFEETLLRGFSFYLLIRAWGSAHKGLLQAAFVQALIFGLVHLVNLHRLPMLDVLAQVIYATLLGFSFAGLVCFTRSLWPAVMIHTFINAVGTLDEFFDPTYTDAAFSSPGINGYALAIGLIVLVAALPGYWLLKKSTAQPSCA